MARRGRPRAAASNACSPLRGDVGPRAGARVHARRDDPRHGDACHRGLGRAGSPEAPSRDAPHPSAHDLGRRTSSARAARRAPSASSRSRSRERRSGDAFDALASFLERRRKAPARRRGRRRRAQGDHRADRLGGDVDVVGVGHARGGARRAREAALRLHGARSEAPGRQRASSCSRRSSATKRYRTCR